MFPSVFDSLMLSLPFVLAGGIAIALVIGLGVGLQAPRILAYPFLATLFWVSGNTFGIQGKVAPPLYSRGSGILLFPIFLWAIIPTVILAYLARTLSRQPGPSCNLTPWYFAWLALLAAHVGTAIVVGVPIAEALSQNGIVNIVWQGVFVLLVIGAFSERQHARELAVVVIVLGLLRAAYGLVRWAAFGGDPANVYANHQGLSIKLTFFDINDSLVCAIAFCTALITLMRPDCRPRALAWRLTLWATMIATSACIVLSFRRTAWLGLVLASLVAIVQLPPRTRFRVAVAAVPAIFAGLLVAAWKRLSQTRGAGGLESFFYDLESRRAGPEGARLLELKLVWADFLDHPLFGIGSWGRYKGSELISWQTGEAAGAFLHSGVLHIALKSGLLGLILFAGLAAAYIRHYRQRNATFAPEVRPLAIAGVAGMAFMIPDLLIGTPIPQIRTMLMMGLCLALPYLGDWEGALRQARTASSRAVGNTPASASRATPV